MAQNARIRDQRIEPAKRIQIASTESDHADLEQDLPAGGHGICNVLDGRLTRLAKYESFHGYEKKGRRRG